MLIRRLRGRKRRGAVLVETSAVIGLVLMLVLAVFEYGRLFIDWNLLNNAAREGCRYALANNTSTTISTTVQSIVTSYMAGQTSSFSNFTVTVTGTHLGVSTPVNSLEPGDPLTVSVSGTFNFLNIIPFVRPTSFVITSGVTMLCEGGT